MDAASPTPIVIRRLSAEQVITAAPYLATVLLDCVAGGASVSFMADLTRAQAEAFWQGVGEAAREDGRALFVAEDEMEILGTVQLIPILIDNQPHRAEVSKMLVHRRARRRGVGERLMLAAEDAARAMGRTLLTLDTVPGEAGERLYLRLGWTAAGTVPDFALYPDGRLTPTTYYYKRV